MQRYSNLYLCCKYHDNIAQQDLVKDLQSELGGNLENVVLALMEPCELFDARSLRSAMKVFVANYHMQLSLIAITPVLQGLGTDEEVLIEVLCTRTNAVSGAAIITYHFTGCIYILGN